jgi:hypothetical protein
MSGTPTIIYGNRFVDLPRREAERVYELGKAAISKQVPNPINRRHQRKYADRTGFRLQDEEVEYNLVISHSRKGIKRVALDYYVQTGGGILGTGSTRILRINPVIQAFALPDNSDVQVRFARQTYKGRAKDSVRDFLSAN